MAASKDTQLPRMPEILPLGTEGVLLRLSTSADATTIAAVQNLRRELENAALPGVTEIAAALGSVLVRFDPSRVARAELGLMLTELLANGAWAQHPRSATRRWTIPAVFGGTHGPQLAEAAAAAQRPADRAIAEIAATDLSVLAIGFAPGQPYLGLLPENWQFPRMSALNPHVPAGALVVAVRQLVLFSAASATGWRHIGQTAFRPFQPDNDTPFALRPGDALRLSPISTDEYEALARTGDPMGGARCEALS